MSNGDPVECASATTDMAEGDFSDGVSSNVAGFSEASTFLGDALEFCFAGDRADRGSGMVSVSVGQGEDGRGERRRDKSVERHEGRSLFVVVVSAGN